MGVELLDVAMRGNTMVCFHACMLEMLDMLDVVFIPVSSYHF